MSRLYFNNAFSKQPLAEVAAAMQPYLRDEYENPLTESDGAEMARSALAQTRQSLANLISCDASEIYFVSSGTEANNWALKGTAGAARKGKDHLIISAVEHFSVYQTAQFLQRSGYELTIVPVNREGVVDPSDVEREIRPSTFLVSVQSASDEIGVIQNLQGIASLKSRFGDVLFHTDAVQFVCYESLNLNQLPFDLITVTSNAIYGPAGIAALYIRKGTRIVPLLHGGMQEEGLRPGLQSMALIVGFGEAATNCVKKQKQWKEHIGFLQHKMLRALERIPAQLTGSTICRVVDNIHLLTGADGEAVLTMLLEHQIRGSSGSTCYQYAQKESHVLKALGINSEQAKGAVLFTLDVYHSADDVALLVDHLAAALYHLRALKP